MQIMGPVTFDEVLTAFRQDHPVAREHGNNTNQDAENVLFLADKLFTTWSKARLSRADFRDVMLPWHLSEGGGFELVPRTGRTVGQAADLVRSRTAELATANPVCMAKITQFGDSPFSSVYLSTSPVTHDHYADLPTGEGLVHLDGLHRLLAWELSGRLSLTEELSVYIAGDLSPGSTPNATTGGRRA
ncbi:hypothetical protein QR77_18815 [Streptomyces sp. 150FB]|uniref:DUF6309 family protein n=1 Tax=Streptomyces sp. 150FB TaxID=1576605 RepID=UPI0005890835|nr:DUF6309 family protein [Streptomyces sp. 150FB]KIF75396.1 hypothetical protein QR77_18815 [Streptomyces sp. 150FB]